MHALYVIQNNVTNEFYLGYTKNLKERLSAHNARGKKATTRLHGEWRYVYVELYRDELDAREGERKLKHHGSSKHELFKRIKQSVL